MKIALITTTINIPQVLIEYDLATRYTDHSVQIFVAGDTISKDEEITNLLKKLSTPSHYISYKEQSDRWPALSEVIGPRKIQRRNFAYLAALESKPDVVITIDDDNAPVNIKSYYDDFVNSMFSNENTVFFKNKESLKANPYNIDTIEKVDVWKRGCSITNRANDKMKYNTRITAPSYSLPGVVEGIALGDPDIDAITRINMSSNYIKEFSHSIAKSEISWAYPNDYVPYNSQNTMFLADLVKYQFLFPYVGRYDDILAGYMSQLVFNKLNYYVKFGQPFAIQLRNQHNLIKDLKDETWGMENMDNIIDQILIPGLYSDDGLNPDDVYFNALTKIPLLCKDFDERNIKAANMFFDYIDKI